SLIILNYKFQHDRVQQAAYALIDENDKQTVHLKIGRMLLASTLSDPQEENIFAIVDHLNKGKNLIASKAEKVHLSQLNLKAGKKAQKSTAYTAAKEYFMSVKGIFPGNIWKGKNNYKMAIDLYKSLAQVEYLNSNFQESELLIELAINRVKSALERSEFYYLLIELYTMQGKYLEAIHIGRTALAQLSIDFPDCDFNKAVETELGKFSESLGKREVASLIDNPEMEDPIKQMALELLIKMLPPSYLGAPQIAGVVMAKSANLSVEDGHTSKSAISYGIFGLLQAMLGNYQLSYELTLLGYQLSKKFDDLYSISQTANLLANFSGSWVKHIKQTENINAESIEAGLQSGMLQYAGFSMTHTLLNGIYQGKNLSLLPQEASDILPFCQKTKNQWSVDCTLGQKIILQNLLGQTQDKVYFGGDEIQESDYLNPEEVSRTPNAICYYYIFKAQVLYLYGELQLALASIAKAQELLGFISGTIQASTYNFYYSLILAALHPSVSPEEQQEYWTKIESNQAQMKNWANNCPENFLHKYLLVAAEMTRISGNWYEAIDLYDRAIKLAKENEFIQDEALANELAAKFWFAQEKHDFAQIYLKKAYQGYQIWGAKRKVEDLDEKYLQWLGSTQTDTENNTINPITTTGSNSGEALDFAAVMKASQAISGEIVLEQLLNQVMKTVIENAGAQKGFLILDKVGNWAIEAEAAVECEIITIMQSIPVDSVDPATGIPLLSTAIVNYVARSHENVVLNNATDEGLFTGDSYITATQPKSILCTPLLNQGKLGGILYLENNLAIGAFTSERVETLKIIAAQAAISIENASLYEQLEDYNRTLEQKVEDRTAELAQANTEILSLNELLKVENIRMSAELDVTRRLQQMILPHQQELESIEGLEIAAFMEPADEVGGDYYDVLNHGGKATIGIGDVTGHGLESGVLMIMAQTAIRTLLVHNETDPVKLLQTVNQTLFDNVERMNCGKSMSLSLLEYRGDNILRLSGQHEEVIVMRSSGEVERIDTIELGFPIALEPDIADFIATTEIQLNTGDVVVLYTDGITEAFDMNQKEYGIEPMIEIVALNREKSAAEIKQAIIDDVRRYIGKQKVFDDITLVIIKQK
ncbi:SpoIIE family protein phosphatase, partial [Microcoleus sp. Pol12B4]|uniref:SpoIIE family protein phosphatase n=1 Tax=Microcoleus sp. Pol12B4 TaxID=3055395 RepID=UPI002FD32EE9